METVSIAKFSREHAVDLVKTLAVAQRMNMVQTEEDLTNLMAAGIETALEDFIQKMDSLNKNT